jgi:hypothetical protein
MATSVVAGLTAHSQRLAGVSSAVRNAVKAAQTVTWGRALPVVTTAIDSVQRRIFLEGERLAPRDRRVLVSWKLGLEQLRCILLDVRFSLEVSDSILTGRQLFFFRVRSFAARDTLGPTYLMLPAIRKEGWIVNEAQENAYPVSFPSEFRVITPETLQVTSGPSGVAVHSLRARLPVTLILYHDHPDRTRDFEYRLEIPLRIAAKHVFELFTPLVRAQAERRVAYSVTNVSRDRLPATVSVVDSLVGAAPRPLLLRVKDEVVTDTLTLEYRGPLPAQDYPVKIFVGPRQAAKFLVRTFGVERDTSLRVGVLSAFPGDAVSEALGRAGIPHMTVRGLGDSVLRQCNVFVIDRDALALVPDAAAMVSRFHRWVADGGHLLVLPQWYGGADPGPLTQGITFARDGGVDIATQLRIDSSVALQPNRLASGDLEGWAISRAFGSLNLPDPSSTTVLVTDDRGRPLVAGFRNGKGSVLVSSLDLHSQLLNVHPGAHRLFVNLLARR